MSHENIETTRRLFKAVEERDVAGVLPLMILRLSSAMLHHYLWRHSSRSGRAKQHVEIAAQTWNHLQPEAARKMNGVFRRRVCRRALAAQRTGASSGRTLDSPVVSVYKMRHGKVIESQMFYSDTAA